MAGRYQGYHFVRDRGFEVFWQGFEVLGRGQGWFWRPLCRLEAGAVGPFTTSTQAYQNGLIKMQQEQ
jgi:hypothetical protein